MPVCLSVFVEDDVWNIFEQEDATLISVYPNPATDQVSIALPEACLNDGYTVFDSRGSKITHGTVSNPTLDLLVSTWSSGLYVVAFDHGNRVQFDVIH